MDFICGKGNFIGTTNWNNKLKLNTYYMYKDFLVMKIGTLEQESDEMIITDKGSR